MNKQFNDTFDVSDSVPTGIDPYCATIRAGSK